MQYRPLSKVFHAAHHAQARELVETTYCERLTNENSVHTGVLVRGFPLFCVVDAEVEVLVSELQQLDAQLMRQFKAQELRDLAGSEVVASNDIEGVAIPSALSELAMYRYYVRLLEVTSAGVAALFPGSVQQMRGLYDDFFATAGSQSQGELVDSDAVLDGELFRSHPVHVVTGAGHVTHAGFSSESEIITGVDAFIELELRRSAEDIATAVMSHYLFEAIHPFYDGNGRLGRYLLSVQMRRSLSAAGAMMVSQAIFSNERTYYKAFSVTQNPLNYSDGTPFVIMMLEMFTAYFRAALGGE